MAKTKIEWATKTWNPIRGCSKVSDGCRNCYAIRQAHRFSGKGQPYEGLTRKSGTEINWTGKVMLVPEMLDAPLKWRKPERIFVNSMSDLFHEDVEFAFIVAIFRVMALAPHHTFQILTKRPERMLGVMKLMPEALQKIFPVEKHPEVHAPGWPLPNVWIGVSVENQKVANERIPLLLKTLAAVRFLSMEPLLGPVDLSKWKPFDGECFCQNEPNGCVPRLATGCPKPAIDWVIVGGESGHKARPMHPDWVRSIRDQCQAAGVPFFFKQWGESVMTSQMPPELYYAIENHGDGIGIGDFFHRVGKKRAGRLLDDREWNEYPQKV